MSSYICPRCGYKHHQLCQFKYHLQRRHPCKPLLSNISIEDVKKKYIIEKESKYTCEGCNKKFSSRSGWMGHVNKCIHNVNTDDAKHVLAELREPILKSCKASLEFGKHIVDLKNHISESNRLLFQVCDLLYKISNATPNFVPPLDISPQISQPAIVKIKDFGQEEVFHLFENQTLMKHIFSGYESGITRFIDLVWFDSQTPQNMNLRIIDADNAQVCMSQKWLNRKLSNVISTLLDYIGCFFQQALEKKQFVSDDFLDDYMEKVGCSLEWDLSYNDETDFGYDNYDIEDDAKDKMQEKIHLFVKTHLLKKTPL